MSKEYVNDVATMEPMFNPKSVAIIGASNNIRKPSGIPLPGLLKGGYKGQIYPVNPRYDELMGYKCYPSLAAIPDEIDLAIVAVPAALVLASLEACVEKGVKAAVIITSGFAELGSEGAKEQEKITRLAKESGLRICGPNTVGLMSFPSSLNATFLCPEFGNDESNPNFLGFVSQSGGFGYGIFEMVRPSGIGFSHFISSGNEADLIFSDYISYLAQNSHTKVIGGYLEGARDGKKFLDSLDAALEAGKPVVLIKTGRSDDAAKAAASHTGSMVGSDNVYEAVFRQKGVIRVESFHELLATLTIFTDCKPHTGNRVAIIAGSGGAGVYLTDKCSENGLRLAEYTEETKKKLREILPPFVSVNNPVDLTSFLMDKPEIFLQSCQTVSEDPNVDILIISNSADETVAELLMSEERLHPYNVADTAEFVRSCKKPVLTLFWGYPDVCQYAVRNLVKQKAPAVYEMEYGVRALGAALRYNNKRRSYKNRTFAAIPPDAKSKASDIINRYAPGSKIGESDAKKVIASYGIAVAREEKASDSAAAVAAAQSIGFPVVLKIDSPDIAHKTEAGGVRLNLKSAAEVQEAFTEIINSARNYSNEAKIDGVLVQEMLPAGVEVIAGIAPDSVFGPTVLFGLGGIMVEVLRDVALGVPPLSLEDAFEMIEEIKGKKMLDGFRGLPAADKRELAGIIAAVAQIALDFPEIAELDVNPLICTKDGAKAADALLVLKE